MAAVLLPTSLTKDMASGLQTPSVSTSTGQNSCMGNKAVYFERLHVSTCTATDPAAADPATIDDLITCDGARVSEHVKFHSIVRP